MTKATSVEIEDVCSVLRQKIRNLELTPGTRLVEKNLMEDFGTSRAVIRQALLVLTHEGIVSHIANRGAVVSTPSLKKAREIISLRKVLEKECVRVAATKITPSQIQALQEMIDKERIAVQNDKIPEALVHSSDFHAEISRITQNETSHHILQEILGISSLVCSIYSKSHKCPCHFEDHQKILELLAKEDSEAAMLEMQRHLDNLEMSLNLEDRVGLLGGDVT
ncbi:GntR family transcriptional regulator [Qingshengfaniella alkalisoli]|uniref:GntR family transcriptional regulator n=1 Tax=Qingshengfaniella alkalisoli TaxID=2599296 RepID=A0A5B8IXP5_9RHOB|nr:GntR family transcriptional regulator [Qingshengfaniella alkalisoli]QDY70504.1 GntR family transcriptional regulator [Qingshengfaniella alkalisoli]